MSNKEPIFEYLESIAEFIPASFYWFDVNSRFMNLNNRTVKAVGAQQKFDVIGKTVYELYQDYDIAHKIQQDINEVMKTGNPSLVEDKIIDVTTGKFRYFSATRGPLKNDKGEIVGVVGTSIEITDEKNAEHLKAEIEAQKIEAERQKLLAIIVEQEKFRKIVDQMSHDIGSPLFAISVMVQSCDTLPEESRNILKQSADRIRDIAGHLLNHYKPKDSINNAKSHTIEPVLVSSEILEILAEKRYEYNNYGINFSHNFSPNGSFTFINTSSSSFKRMLSNIINNAVDAIESSSGKVVISLNTISDNKEIQLIIEDNGVGMPDETKKRLLNNLLIISSKPNGHGIGLEQVRETLSNSNGKLNVESEVGVGTKIILTFPIVESPKWMIQTIDLLNLDSVVILDDDQSIHGAWDFKFEKYAPNLKRYHFEKAQDTIKFIQDLDPKELAKTLLLTDFELLNQRLDGLEVIKRSKIQHAILVTSHFANPKVISEAQLINTKVLPKQLASEILIRYS